MTRKELQALFPPVPGHFVDRIERTMEEIEAMNTNKSKRIRRMSRPVLIAAIIFVLAAATALAAVLGNHALKDMLNDSGLEDAAGQVADIHATDASDGFGLTLDEAAWEGEKLYLSCTIAVPEDGKQYLYGMMMPKLNGEYVAGDVVCWFDSAFGPVVCPIGGDYPAEATLILPLTADSAMLADGPAALSLSAAFFTTDRGIAPMPADDEALTQAEMERFDGPCRKGGYVFKSSDTLYCEGGLFNTIELTNYREVAAINWLDDPDYWVSSGAKPETIAATGIVDYLGSRTLSLALDEAMCASAVLNDVKERQFTWKDVTFTVERFRMTHFSFELVLHAEPADGKSEESTERLHGAELALLNGDGRELLGLYGDTVSRCLIDDDPDGGYTVTVRAEALFPTEPQPFRLVPEYLEPTEDENAFEFRVDADDVITRLTPVYSETVREAEAAEQAQFEAVRDWQPGDAGQTVYATEKGRYYHCDPDCSGMLHAEAMDIADALASGKSACPVCIGGPNSRPATEENEVHFWYGNQS